MAMRIQRPAEAGAPAYMVQYTAVMMLLLAFFIALLSAAKFGPQQAGMKEGLGKVRNAFGTSGGLGILPFVAQIKRNFKDLLPSRELDETSGGGSDNVLGLQKTGRGQFSDARFLRVRQITRGIGLKVDTPIRFDGEAAALDGKAREYLARMGSLLHALPDTVLTVSAYCRPGDDPGRRELLAVERAAAVIRYLEKESGVSRSRLRAVGVTHESTLGVEAGVAALGEQAVWFFIHKRIPPVES
ncbi:MAG: OmpA family protein [Lentisphaerae bacterium]|nr:OmpA family protein [Lentisphaerota bacterium]